MLFSPVFTLVRGAAMVCVLVVSICFCYFLSNGRKAGVILLVCRSCLSFVLVWAVVLAVFGACTFCGAHLFSGDAWMGDALVGDAWVGDASISAALLGYALEKSWSWLVIPLLLGGVHACLGYLVFWFILDGCLLANGVVVPLICWIVCVLFCLLLIVRCNSCGRWYCSGDLTQCFECFFGFECSIVW